jgi:hypothetical protein
LLRKPTIILALLTLGAVLVHGYHPFVEDAEIYLPGVEKKLNPNLFPFNAEFFEAHAHLTLFPNLIAASVRLSHLPLPVILLSWHLISVFLLLLAAWLLSSKCFPDQTGRWAAVTLIAALLTLPVAGTALYIMDQYVNPRNLTACAGLFAIVKTLDRKYFQAAIVLLAAVTIHPLMPVYAMSFCILLVMVRNFDRRMAGLACLLPFSSLFAPPSEAYHQVALSHPYHYFLQWQWYEWLGAIGPLLILWWFSRLARQRKWSNLELLCRTLIIYELLYIPPAVVLSGFTRFEALARLQPMRCLHLLYILFFLFIGGLLGEFVLKDRAWRWIVLFAPIYLGMFLAQRALFPASAHIEWPVARPKNRWVQAFRWVRNNTPENALFAIDPRHMNLAGEDEHGFRAIAERSRLADAVKDAGAVTMFPPLAEEWMKQVQAQSGWKDFQLSDFHRLQTDYGVNWVVLQQPGRNGLECPYRNDAVLVCRLN